MYLQGWGVSHGLIWMDARYGDEFCGGFLPDGFFSDFIRKQTGSRVTTATFATTGKEIRCISVGWGGNSHPISQDDRDLPVKFRAYVTAKHIDLTNGIEICFGN